jgi:hypothetical protein
MSVSSLRNLACWMMCGIFPLSLAAQESGAAMLRSNGGVWVNSKENPESTAIFSGDLIETNPGSVANIDVQGSSVLIQPESVVEWGDNVLSLDHGSVTVGTSTEFRVKVNCLNIVPVVNQWTQYDVTNVDGTVRVFAHKLDVNITQGNNQNKSSDQDKSAQDKRDQDKRDQDKLGQDTSGSATVHEGDHASREASVICGAAKPPGVAGGSPISTTRWIEIGSGGGGAALLCILLCRGSSPASVSTSNP